jgi:hypothetical protein
VSGYNAKKLHMYSLIDGTRMRSIGSQGGGKGQFNFDYGGLCTSSDGDSVLVADYHNNRVQEVRIVDGTWVRFIGEGVLNEPQYVDCNSDVIVVSEPGNNCISVMSWADGGLRVQFGSYGRGPWRLSSPRGIRLLVDGSGVVVVDCWNNRLCIFTLSGELVAAVVSGEQGLCLPYDVLECASDGSFIVANLCHSLVNLSRDGVTVEVLGKLGNGDGPGALSALPNDGCLVLAREQRVQHLTHLRARLAWMCACARCIV